MGKSKASDLNLQNITEVDVQQQIINEQREEIFQLKSIINKLPGSVYWKDPKGVYLGCNDVVLNMAGLSTFEEIIGKTDFDMPWKNYAHEIRAVDEQAMNSSKPLVFEESPTLSNGQKVAMFTHKAALKNKFGTTVGVIGISIDISERKQMEQELNVARDLAEAANKTKTEFLENMRHDIRTPLTGIVGFSNFLRKEKDAEKIKEFAAGLAESSNELLNFLNEVLEAINVASGEIPLVEKKFNLRDTLEKVIRLNKAKIYAGKLKLIFDYDASIPDYLIGDPIRIYRVVLELIVNALKFTSHGSVTLIAKLIKRQERNVLVEIAVKDTGIGMEIEKQQELFLRFKRLTPSYQGIYKGAGLGLSIIKQFIHDLQGEIYVKSELNQGTTFTCLFPFKEALLDNAFGVDDNQIDQTPNKILIVEYQLIAATILKNILLHMGKEADVAVDGKTAINLSNSKKYSLIFMDIGLPDLDGCKVANRIKEIAQQAQYEIPIVAVTAHTDLEMKQRCLDAGIEIILNKPILEAEIIDILNLFNLIGENSYTKRN